MNATDIREHMEVVGSDGGHVGVVDAVEGDRIKLTKSDATVGGRHRYLPLVRVERVDERVVLDRSAAEVTAAWSGTGRDADEADQDGTARDAGLVRADEEVADGAATAGRAQAVPATGASPDAGSQ